jgi:hypothetical protein
VAIPEFPRSFASLSSSAGDLAEHAEHAAASASAAFVLVSRWMKPPWRFHDRIFAHMENNNSSAPRVLPEPPQLTVEGLQPGGLYQVTSPVKFHDTPILPGTVLKFCRSDHNWHDNETSYIFENHSPAPEPEEWWLSSYEPMMEVISRWLKPFTGQSEVCGVNPTQALLDACEKGDVEGARAALNAYVPSASKRRKAFEMACGARSLDCAMLLASLPVVEVEELGDFLRGAAVAGFAPVVQALLAAGAPVNAADCHGQTALIHVGWYGHLELVDLLLAHGADPSLRTTNGSSALDFARALHKDAVATRLEQALASGQHGTTPTLIPREAAGSGHNQP